MEGGTSITMTFSTLVSTAVSGVGSVITAVSSDTTLMAVALVMLAGAIGSLAFRTIKRFVH